MNTPKQKTAAKNAAQEKSVTVRYAYLWPSPRDAVILGAEPKPYFHVVAGDCCVGSTVTLRALHALGLRVEVVA